MASRPRTINGFPRERHIRILALQPFTPGSKLAVLGIITIYCVLETDEVVFLLSSKVIEAL